MSSIAPKERINIVYKSMEENLPTEKELPLKLLVLGDFGDFQKGLAIEKRDAVSVNKNNFDEVLKSMQVELDLDVSLDETFTRQSIPIESIDDFSPDKLVKKISEVDHLLKIRNSLMMLKGPMGNIPAFRQLLEKIVTDEQQREKLSKELACIGPSAESKKEE